jgi:hypothetical protein
MIYDIVINISVLVTLVTLDVLNAYDVLVALVVFEPYISPYVHKRTPINIPFPLISVS